MRILQVNTVDTGGGAESVAWQLMQAYGHAGHSSWMAVGKKNTTNSDVHPITHDPYRTDWSRWCRVLADRWLEPQSSGRSGRVLHQLLALGLGQPTRAFHRWEGKEDFDFPGTARLEDIAFDRPDIVHCHNLHGAWLPDGGYFDLGMLPGLSRRYPLVLTLHDAWLLSGHCAHSFGCDRWKTGCGCCPDLTIYPAVRRDATASNWLKKREIFSASRLFVATPSQWLMDKVQESILSPAIAESRVIPNGVDLTIFKPADKRDARKHLALPQEARIILFTANGVKANPWKDFQTMRAAVKQVASQVKDRPVLFIAVGDSGVPEEADLANIQFVPYQSNPVSVARYYQAADVYWHATRADTFPLTVLEASACGTPVVATAVGGIPEQIVDGRTGLLVAPGDADAMAKNTLQLLENEEMRRVLINEVTEYARRHFDLRHQVQSYLAWYENIVSHHRSKHLFQHAH